MERKLKEAVLIEIGMTSQFENVKLLSIIHTQSSMFNLNLMILTPDPIPNVYQLTALNNLPKLVEHTQTSHWFDYLEYRFKHLLKNQKLDNTLLLLEIVLNQDEIYFKSTNSDEWRNRVLSQFVAVT